MAAINSALSGVTFNTATIAAVGSVSVSVHRNALDVTTLGDLNHYFVPGSSTSVVALDVYYNTTDHSEIVNNLLNASAPTAFEVILAETTDVISGFGIVVSCDISAGAADLVHAQITIQVVGPITISGNAAASGGNESDA